jgi:hypothetical protein
LSCDDFSILNPAHFVKKYKHAYAQISILKCENVDKYILYILLPPTHNTLR